MIARTLLTAALVVTAAIAAAQDSHEEIAKVKEQELEEVRARISELKESMDASAKERDRLTAELQDIEVQIAEHRSRLKEIERDQAWTAGRKQTLEKELADRQVHLDAETEALAAQVRAAYMIGIQQKIRLFLN